MIDIYRLSKRDDTSSRCASSKVCFKNDEKLRVINDGTGHKSSIIAHKWEPSFCFNGLQTSICIIVRILYVPAVFTFLTNSI